MGDGPHSFDAAFDKLIQNTNYRETAGIPIGPEMSRIFAEIILQRIDLNVIKRLELEDMKQGKDYWCYRYIDDIYFFFNAPEDKGRFLTALQAELSIYKLHLNKEKLIVSERPFITRQSLYKIRASEFLTRLWERLPKLSAAKSAREITKLRAIAAFDGEGVGFHNVAAFIISSLRVKVVSLKSENCENLAESLYVLIDLAFHCFRMDTSISCSYKIAELVVDLKAKFPQLLEFEKSRIVDKICDEFRGAIDSALQRGYTLECMNIVIAMREVAVISSVSCEIIEDLIRKCNSLANSEDTLEARLNYFEIVSLLYITRGDSKYTDQITKLLKVAAHILTECDPQIYAESVFLLLDLTACPFLTHPQKDGLIKIAFAHYQPTSSAIDIATFRNFAQKHTWFFAWNSENNLKCHLIKKKLHLSY